MIPTTRSEKITKMLAIFQGMGEAAQEDIGNLGFTILISDHESQNLLLLSTECVVCIHEELGETIKERGIEHGNQMHESKKEQVN